MVTEQHQNEDKKTGWFIMDGGKIYFSRSSERFVFFILTGIMAALCLVVRFLV